MARFLTLASGRTAKWLVLAVWLIGIFVAVGAANLPGKFTEAENNESTSFLPSEAESTRALAEVERLQTASRRPSSSSTAAKAA
jgi:RND superfamily putative drug exporter